MQNHQQPTATLTIRNVDAALKQQLRMRAARHGRSMEAELRSILAAGANIATRDIGVFSGCGIGLINPWEN